MQAIQTNDIGKLVELVEAHPFLAVKPVNDNLLTPLMLGCLCESFDVVEILVESYKVPINEVDYNGLTAVHHCAYKNTCTTIKIAEYLCEQGADLTIKSSSGVTALAIAYALKSKALTRILKYQAKHGKHARHPFMNIKKLLWVYQKSVYKALPKSIIKEICMYY
jgi:ankyrin repeat protein